MRKPVLLLFLALAPSCMIRAAAGYYPPADPPAQPGYVYTYADGACWADGVFYGPPCPWVIGPTHGYYYWWHGHYYFAPHRHWEHRHVRPPPSWRHHPPRVSDHRVHPPRVRDHRTDPRPRVRDHRR